jgi:hypothetical protein
MDTILAGDLVYKGNPFAQKGYFPEEYDFLSFIYFADTDDLWVGGWGNNHDELIAENHGYSNSEALLELFEPTTVFGQVWKQGSPDYVRIDMVASDMMDDDYRSDDGANWKDQTSATATWKARAKIEEWLEENASAAGITLHISSTQESPKYDIIPKHDSWKEAGLPKKAKILSREQVGDYEIVEMSSGEYPNHDALFIDRMNHRIMINYEGHHDPLFQEFPEVYVLPPPEQVAGHWRLEPSTTESFGEGWGWHHGRPTQEEESIITQVLKRHYDVDQIEDSYVRNKEKANKQLKLFAGKYVWLDQVVSAVNRPHPWQAAYLPKTDQIYLTNDPEVDLGQQYATILEGFYAKIEHARGPHVERAREIVTQALAERYPTAMVEKLSYYRWVIDRHGKVSIADTPSHWDLLHEHFETDDEDDLNIAMGLNYVTAGYIDDTGKIEVTRLPDEPHFDPQKVAKAVYAKAVEDRIAVTGKVRWADCTAAKTSVNYFQV